MIPFSFASPLLLWLLAPISGVLLYVYLRRGLGREIQVSSVLLLRKLASPLSSRRKIQIPFRLLFELCLFSLLTFALAKLSLTSEEKKVALIIDNSLSMKALGAFERAKAQSISEVSERGSATRYGIRLTTQSEAKDGLTASSDAIDIVKELKATSLEDSLEETVKKVSIENSWDEILVFSDTKVRSSDSRIKSFVAKEGPASNAAIVGAQRLGSGELRVSVRIYSNSPGEVFLEIKNGYSKNGITSQKAKFKGSELLTFTIEGQENLSSSLLLHARARFEGKEGDALSDDDEFWIPQAHVGKAIGVVSDISVEELGLLSIPGYSFKKVLSVENLPDDVASLIVHRKEIANLPEVSSVFVLPSSRGIFSGEDFTEQGGVTSWKQGHPILSYLNVTLLKLKTFQKLSGPVWATSVLGSSRGDLVLAGEANGNRYSAVGFEIFPFEGKKSLLTGVITLNLLKWAFEGSGGKDDLVVGSRVQDPKEVKEIRMVAPKEELLWRYENTAPFPPFFTDPGLYKILDSKGKERTLSVNVVSQKESDLLALGEVEIGSERKEIRTTLDESVSDLTKGIGILLLALLVMDSLFRHIQGKRRGV